MNSLALSLTIFPEAARAGFRDQVRDIGISPEMMDWMQGAIAALSQHPDLQDLKDQGVVPERGKLDHIKIILCHPEDLEEIFECDENTLGMHQIDNTETDPFGDGTASSSSYRILVSWDPERAITQVMDLEDLGYDHPEDAALSWLLTLGHEIQHVILFAENSNFNSPDYVDLRADELGHDLFDFSTGYGIRPLIIDGEEVEPEDAKHAHNLMEEMVEERGRQMTDWALIGRVDEFLRLLGLASDRPEPG